MITRGTHLLIFALFVILFSSGVAYADSDSPGMSFVPWRDRTGGNALWTAHAPGVSAAITADGVSLALPAHGRQVSLRFLGSGAAVTTAGVDLLPGRANYFIGSDPSAWRTDVPTYGGVVLHELYAGVDLRFEGTSTELKGTFVVAPHVDPATIRWRYKGIDEVRMTAGGDLSLRAGPAVLRETAPIAWQDCDGRRRPVEAGYRVENDGVIRFTIGAYDRERPLVIDPYLEFATLVGGSDGDEGREIVVDTEGNAYVTGSTLSADFPGAGAPQAAYAGPFTPSNLGDAFIFKLAPDGTTVLFMTYLGGGGEDVGDAIVLDPQGNIVVAGTTASTNFPTAAALQGAQGGQDCSSAPCNDLFITKLSASGNSLLFSTYLGGSRDESAALIDFGTRQNTIGIDVDGVGSIYVTGTSDSDDFPVVGGFQTERSGLADLVLVKLPPGGGRVLYSTYLGGTGAEYSGDVTVDDAGRAWLVGGTLSSNFPTRNAFDDTKNPISDAVLAVIDTTTAGDGSLMTSTYLGGDDSDHAFGVGRDAAGRVFVAGVTESLDFPIAGAFQDVNASTGEPNPRDAFLTVFAADARTLLYSTYFGGSGRDLAYDLDVDAEGGAVIAGTTASDDLPLRLAYQARRFEGIDLFVARFDSLRQGDRSLAYSTYLGGGDSDVLYGIDTGSDGSVVVTGATRGTVSDTFPIDRTIGPNATSDGVLVARLQPPQQLWMLVGSRADGANNSTWRTDVGILNPEADVAEVEIRFHGAGGVMSKTWEVPAASQIILDDAVGQLGGSGNGAIEVLANAEVRVTSRTYNLVAAGAPCSPEGTLGQGFGSALSRDALGARDRAWIPQLAETSAYRTNIAVTNTGLASATVIIRLYDGGGSQIGMTTVELDPGQWRQLNRPFFQIAGRSDLAAGYAGITVEEGGGILVVGSVVDNITNDPTTIPMVADEDAGFETSWVLVGSRANGANNSRWRTDLGILNVSGGSVQATVRVHAPGGVLETVVSVGSRDQVTLTDVMDLVSFTGSAAIEIVGDRRLVVSSRTYNQIAANQTCSPNGTLGQGLFGVGSDGGLAEGQSGWLTQLTENASYRTNIALTNTGETSATVTVRLFDGDGRQVASYVVALSPGEWRQENRPFNSRAGLSDLDSGYAQVTVETGSGVLAVASVVDNITNDPTTVVWVR